MYLFRVHIRPQGGTADNKETFAYCLKEQLLGVGWRTESNKNTTVWEDYFSEATLIHDNLNVCKYIKKWVSKNDLVWTRDTEGNYYLAKVLSGWEYWVSDEAKEKDIDIANIFRCEIIKVDIDDVPGKVVACFRPTRTLQEIANLVALEYSKALWNKISKTNCYEIDKTKISDVFSMLDDEETEDLVFLYLQTQGWYVLPNSRKADTMSFEYLCINPKTGEVVGTQVKTGAASINKDNYQASSCRVFLFQPNNCYEGNNHNNIIVISRETILEFIAQNKQWLPKVIRHKLELCTACQD